MTTEYIQIKDENVWLEKRKGYITSTESSAIYGINPLKTAFELWHEKNGNLDGQLQDNNFLMFGRLVEAPICEMIKIERPKWEILPMRVFAFDDDDKIGSSYDRTVKLPNGTTALLEIKSTSYAEYKKKFIEDRDGIEAPTQYEVQMQHELEVVGLYDTIVMAVFLADVRQIKYIFRKRDKEMGAAIRNACRDFWSMTEPPEPDFERDKSSIAKTAPDVNLDYVLDATKDTRISELVAMYKAEKELEKQSKNNADKFYAELVHLAGKNRYIWTNDYKISISDIKPSEGKEITPDMVGQKIGARGGYKRLTITEVKK